MKKVTLTFDNGPTAGITDRILDILAARGIKATFFVVGSQLYNAAAAALLPRMVAEGHWIGNHTLNHSTALGESDEAGYAIREISSAQDLLGEFASPNRLFRPFGKAGALGPHLLSGEALGYLLEQRYTCVVWNNVPRDWEGPAWVERCLATIDAQDWSVVVLHDIDVVDAALPRFEEFLDALAARDVQVVQAFPEEVVLVRDGKPVSLKADYVT